jgi:A/G-specific adenine glycosylase
MDQDVIDRERCLQERIKAEGISPEVVQLFRELIISYYRTYGRDLPWRRTTDPYAILVSEMMLQQTQVDRVICKYEEFIRTFPDIQTLAAAPLREVLAVWQGLGYNRRAIYLQRIAQRVVETWKGTLPADVEALATLPGLGKATASSIVVFAFNKPVTFIETNIRRVYIHFFFADMQGVKDSDILPLVELTLNHENPRDWYNALMDYGSLLKKRVVNPNRRSATYTIQAPLEGSDRQIRGWILRDLVSAGVLCDEDLNQRYGAGEKQVKRIVEALKKEGFISQRRGMIALEGDTDRDSSPPQETEPDD